MEPREDENLTDQHPEGPDGLAQGDDGPIASGDVSVVVESDSEQCRDPLAPVDTEPFNTAPFNAEPLDSTLEPSDDRRAKLPWYVVHTYSGFEGKVKLSLEERVRSKGLDRYFGSILVPHENVVEVVKGQKKTSSRKFFPGYILVQVELNEDTWHLVNDTPRVTGFVGDHRHPSPISEKEVQALLQQMEGGSMKPKLRVNFDVGDSIKVTSGPFADFSGTVDEVKSDKGKLRVLISIFGRNTPVELDFTQVEKV